MGFAAFAKSGILQNDAFTHVKPDFFQPDSASRVLVQIKGMVAPRGPGISQAHRLGLALAFLLAAAPALGQVSGLQEKIAKTNWSEVRGVNFIPSYASNSYEIWRNYDHEIVDRDLRLASEVGYNSVRFWLNYSAYEELGSRMVDRVEDALRLSAKYHLRAVVVLFDSCGIRPRKDAKWMTTREAYEQFQSSTRFSPDQKAFMHALFGNYVQGFGAHAFVPVGADTPFMVLVWQNWQPTPGNTRLGPDWYPKLENYLDAVVGRMRDNPSVLLWDLMNEPEFASEGFLSAGMLITPEMEKVRDAFLRHFRDHLQRRFPDQAVGEGWASLEDAEKYADLADVVTFHIYAEPEKLQPVIEKAQAFGKSVGKPVLITETLANWDFGAPDFGKLTTDEAQLAHYQRVLPVLMKSPIGWMAWGLVISHVFEPFTDIFYPDGHPRPAALFLEKTLKGGRPGS
jgi:hypothetical protein